MFRRSLLLILLLAASATDFAAADDTGFVSLVLSETKATRGDLDTLFVCRVSLDNRTVDDLTVRTTFYSVFDGLELIVTTPEGRTLAQQPYIHHQSPRAPDGRKMDVKRGVTTRELRFPIRDLPADVRQVKVRLVGTLPDSGYRRLLASETLEVKIDR
jgi:hypothetical protein